MRWISRSPELTPHHFWEFVEKYTKKRKKIVEEFNMIISLTNTKVITFPGKYPISCKTILLNSITERVLHLTTSN
jgi:hypothetical protein